jgi:hypothetical protein
MRCKETLILRITEQDAALLLSKEYSADPVTGEIPHSLIFTRQRPSRMNLISRLRRSGQVFVSGLVPNTPPGTENKIPAPQQDEKSAV